MRGLVTLAVLGAVAYIGWNYATPQVRAWRFRDAMQQTARLGPATEIPELRASLVTTADDLGVPLADRGLRIARAPGGRGVRIVATWEEVVRIEGGALGTWVDTLHFDYETRTERSEP